MIRHIVVTLVIFLTSCTDLDKHDIDTLLEQRNAVISAKNTQAYTKLLTHEYLTHQGNQDIRDIQHVFDTFDKVEMQTRDRIIQILDANRAIVEQTYILKVFANGEWRKIVKREQLILQREDKQWKISNGL